MAEPIGTALLAAICEAVSGYLLKRVDPAGPLVDRLRGDATRKAFQRALKSAFTSLPGETDLAGLGVCRHGLSSGSR